MPSWKFNMDIESQCNSYTMHIYGHRWMRNSLESPLSADHSHPSSPSALNLSIKQSIHRPTTKEETSPDLEKELLGHPHPWWGTPINGIEPIK